MESCRRSSVRASGLSPLSPLLPLLLSLARGAVPPPPPAPRQMLQLLQSAVQGAVQNAAPVRPLQALQGVGASRPLQALENASPVRPLQALQSQLPVRPLQSLQGLPAVSWLQNSLPVTAFQNAAANAAASLTVPGGNGQKEVLLPSPEGSVESRGWRRRRSVDGDLADSVAEDLLEEGGMLPPASGDKQPTSRQEKALQYLSGGYLAVAPPGTDFSLDLEEAGLTLAEDDGNELLSRAAPFRNRNQPDSPIYYIRLPPTPYVLVPGVGYVSAPGRRPIGSLGPAPPPPPPAASPSGSSTFYNLPLSFVSNGKPTGVYQPTWAAPPQRPPAPPPVRPPSRPPPQQMQPSAMFSLNKGPYVFNGRPTDIFILRDSYDTLYGDALSSFYP